ncbi:MAG: AraC family transcriptional regulator ligand-binding domain-containing protein [Gammaproteobacteria bacterium]|nr:AraC family transcriptional regulator ligand-binding domain-containing protein [Gammaproteobacteria bacterium]
MMPVAGILARRARPRVGPASTGDQFRKMTTSKLHVGNRIGFYLARMAARGFANEQVLAGTGLEAVRIGEGDVAIEPGDFRKIVGNMLRLTNDPRLGIAMGAEFKVSDLGVLGYAALTASTLEQSRKLFLKYTPLNERVITTSNEIRDGKWFSEIREMFPLEISCHSRSRSSSARPSVSPPASATARSRSADAPRLSATG